MKENRLEEAKEKVTANINDEMLGRMGGIIGLDPEMVWIVMQYGIAKADYWEERVRLYIQFRREVNRILQKYGIDRHTRFIASSIAQGIVKCYAKYPDEPIANHCAESVSHRLRELGIPDTAINEITALSKEIGKSISHMYSIH